MNLLAPAPGWTSHADVIVVGSGVAGLTTALQVRTFGLSVLLVTKAKVDEGSTKWAQGGIAAALGPGAARRADMVFESGRSTIALPRTGGCQYQHDR